MTLLRDAVKMGGAYAIMRTGVKELNKHQENKQAYNQNQNMPQQQWGPPPSYSQPQGNRGPLVTSDGYVHADFCNGRCEGRCNGTQTAQRSQQDYTISNGWADSNNSRAMDSKN